jgi:hypothetical protein
MASAVEMYRLRVILETLSLDDDHRCSSPSFSKTLDFFSGEDVRRHDSTPPGGGRGPGAGDPKPDPNTPPGTP